MIFREKWRPKGQIRKNDGGLGDDVESRWIVDDRPSIKLSSALNKKKQSIFFVILIVILILNHI